MRFEVIQNIPSPYRLHLFRFLWQELQTRGFDFHVNFMSDMSRGHSERPLSWHNPLIDFPHKYWRDFGISNFHLNPGLLWHLRHVRPDVLLVGSTFDTMTSALASYLVPARIKCAWSEGNTKTTGRMHGILGWYKREIFSRYQYIGVPGRDAMAYVELHQSLTNKKMPQPIFLPNLVDETRFKVKQLWQDAEIANIRSKYMIPQEARLCLIPARLEPVKGLVEFFSQLTPDLLKGWKILVLGQGYLREQLQSLLEARCLTDNVRLESYIPYAEMPAVYGAADLFLLPSLYDPNPLSVVEALHSGLPVAVTSMAGNVEEAVTAGENGWVLPVKDHELMSRTLAEVFASSRERLREMGLRSRTHASFWDSREAVQRFVDALCS